MFAYSPPISEDNLAFHALCGFSAMSMGASVGILKMYARGGSIYYPVAGFRGVTGFIGARKGSGGKTSSPTKASAESSITRELRRTVARKTHQERLQEISVYTSLLRNSRIALDICLKRVFLRLLEKHEMLAEGQDSPDGTLDITREEFEQIVHVKDNSIKDNIPSDEILISPEEIDTIFEFLDTDGDFALDYRELRHMMPRRW